LFIDGSGRYFFGEVGRFSDGNGVEAHFSWSLLLLKGKN